MKKLFIFAAIVFAAVTFTIVSCKKDNPKETQNSNADFATTEPQENMDEYLLSFKKKLQNATKGSETISIEQAERDLENLLNFDFGDASYATNVFQYDTLYSNISVDNGQIDYAEISAVYNEIKKQILKTYLSVTLPLKSVFLIRCEFKESNRNNNDSFEIETVVVTRGYSEDENTRYTSDYSDWISKDFGGTCDGLLVGVWGAPQEMVWRLSNIPFTYACANPQSRLYFTENGASYIDYSANNMEDTLSPCGYKLYKSDVYDQSTVCIYSNEFDYYRDQARYLPSTNSGFYPPIPSDHVIISYSIRLRDSDCNNNIVTVPWYWELIVEHAKPNCTPATPIPD